MRRETGKEVVIMEKSLDNLFAKYGITCYASQREKLERYMQLVLDKNENLNLTAIEDTSEFIVKHFLDSAILLSIGEYETAREILDMGTGGGFPGVPLAILSPEKDFLLIDSLKKRIRAVSEMTAQIGLSNVRVMHGRAEELARLEEFRDRFDMCVSRAVADLSTLAEYCLPFVKKSGHFIAYKSEEVEAELSDARPAIAALEGKFVRTENIDIEGNTRTLLLFTKTSVTPDRFPRRAGKPLKTPIK